MNVLHVIILIFLLLLTCVCDSCYRDFTHFKSLTFENDFMPRWFKIKQEKIGNACSSIKHCVLCCNNPVSCVCDNVYEWGPDSWWSKEGKTFWLEYLSFLNVTSNVLELNGFNICRYHYKQLRHNISSKWNHRRQLLESCWLY